MENIRDDLLTEILIRLPDCRQAVRCAAVCKGWSSLICGDQFAQSFIAHHRGLDDADFSAPVLPLLFEAPHFSIGRILVAHNRYVFGETELIRTINYLRFLPWKNMSFPAYCDDLLLVSNVASGRFLLCVCNPMTKKYLCILPEPPIRYAKNYKCLLTCRRQGDNRGYLSYHVTIFFGYDIPARTMWTTDFSSETGRWSSPTLLHLQNESFMFSNLSMQEPVNCADGLVYWLGGILPEFHQVIAFDPLAAPLPDGQRDFRVMQRPGEIDENLNFFNMRLGTYRGRLRAAYIVNASSLRVWELNHASSRWSLVHDAALGLSIPENISPVALHPSNRNVVMLRISTGEILHYDMSSRTSHTLGQIRKDTFYLSTYPLCSIWPTPIPSLDTHLASLTIHDGQATTETLKHRR